jgi:hypothetical protein
MFAIFGAFVDQWLRRHSFHQHLRFLKLESATRWPRSHDVRVIRQRQLPYGTIRHGDQIRQSVPKGFQRARKGLQRGFQGVSDRAKHSSHRLADGQRRLRTPGFAETFHRAGPERVHAPLLASIPLCQGAIGHAAIIRDGSMPALFWRLSLIEGIRRVVLGG